jgi:hypothetical protein
MQWTRSEPQTPEPNHDKRFLVKAIWASDGWCYVPQLKFRQKFSENLYFSEAWEGVVPLPEYEESLTITLYSHSPRHWRESSEHFDEVYKTS